jgi:hypothetical protein
MHLLQSASAARPAVRPSFDLNLSSVRARARLLGFNQWLRPHVQRRFRASPRSRPRIAVPWPGAVRPPFFLAVTCVGAARPRPDRRQGLRQVCAGRLPLPPAGSDCVASPPLQVCASARMRHAQLARARHARSALSRAPERARRARSPVLSLRVCLVARLDYSIST